MDNLYIATVRIRVSGKIIMPGDTVDGLSEKEMNFLLKKRFVNVKRISVKGEPKNDKSMIDGLNDNGSDEEDEGDTGVLKEDNDLDPDTVDDEIPQFYTEEQLNKLKSKADIISYAESIGLAGLDVNLHRPELIDKVLAYIDEVQK